MDRYTLMMRSIEGWQTEVLEHIGKRVGEIGKMSIAEVQQLNNIAYVTRDVDGLMQELADVMNVSIYEAQQIYAESLEELHLANQPLYDFRGKEFLPIEDDLRMQAIIRSASKNTAQVFKNWTATKAIGLATETGVKTLARAYTDILDKATMQVVSGATDFHSAMRGALSKLGGGGVRVDYGGVSRRLDTSVRQSLLYGIKETHREYNQLIAEELDTDGVEIDAHSYSRPSHEFMQGKQYAVGESVTVKGEKYEGTDEATSPETGETVTESLQDYGCRHDATPIVLGVSVPAFSKEQLQELNEQNHKEYTIDGKTQIGYYWTQDMRKLETEIRAQKGERDIYRASGDKAAADKCTQRIKACKAKYDQITEVTGIKGSPDRMTLTR